MPLELALAMALVVGAGGVALGIALGMALGRRGPGAEQDARPVKPAPADDIRDRLAPADQLGIGLIVLGPDGLVSAANRSAESLLEARPGGLAGKSTMEAFIDHTVEGVIAAARRDGQAETQIVTGGEPQRTLEIHAWPDADSTWVALRDVSELRRLRRIRTEFVDNLSHELRTPLTTVRLLTESLTMEAERTELPERVRESIARIDVETGHLAQMVTELLELSRIEQGDTPLRRTAVDLGAVVQHTVERLGLYAERQGVDLRAEIPDDVGRRTVTADEERIGQLLVNFVHNAIKFSPDGGEVVVRIAPGPDDVVIAVEDHGIGIKRADLVRVFERFYKADRARARGAGGTGLGLSIARHIAERHGGRVWAESRGEGHGSTFFLSLPRAARPGSTHPCG